MANLQQADLLEFVTPQSLKPHPLNVAIYGDGDYQDLVGSIKTLGVLQALYVTSHNVILSGHRRWRAAIAASCPTIPIIRMNYTNELDERQAIIEHNRYRIKNGQQLWNEGQELKTIEVERAKARSRANLKQYTEVESLPPRETKGKTRDIIAHAIGLGSGKQWDKLEYVAENNPQRLKDIKPDGISLSRAYIETRKDTARTRGDITPLPEGLFNVIYADPPWQYSNSIDNNGPANLHYRTISIEEIRQFKDSAGVAIQHKFADNAVLFLWVTNPLLRDAFQIVDAWGFQYKTNIVWIKTDLKRPGVGFWVRGRHELLFICSRGSFLPNQTGQEPIGSVFEAPIQEHSRKPEAIYDLIERMYPEGKYLELFARNRRDKWTSWGNEIEQSQ